MSYRRGVFAIVMVGAILAMILMVRGLAQPRRELVDGIVIEGSSAFIARTRAALLLVKDASYVAYAQLTRQVLTIQEFDRSGSDVWSRRIQVAKRTRSYSLTWYASTLVHECRHIAQYNDYLAAYPDQTVPELIYTGQEAELNCMLAQIDVLQRMNAPAKELEWARKQDGNFSDLNGDGKYDQADYKKRDW